MKTKDCHNFLAGNAIRSMNRYKALDETAIFGRGCRHEFTKKFLSLRHGERLAYAVWVLQELEKENADNPGLKINILYGVACMLVKHLQNLDEDPLLHIFQFAIPIFHCYGHIGQCEVKFSPRRKEGFGLTDGEMLERVWAYVRKFGKMTKEMRPSHRVDVLSDALLHCGLKTIKKLGGMLVERIKRAIDVEKVAKSDIEKLCQCLNSSNVSVEDIHSWINDEVDFFENEVETDENAWKRKYVIYLDLYNDLYQRWNCCTDPNQLTVQFNQMKKIDEELKVIEEENVIVSRWLSSDQQYQDAKGEMLARRKRDGLSKMRKTVIERWFLLGLKSKYSDGQTLAKRISKKINQVTKDLKKEIEALNADERSSPFDFPGIVSFDAVKDPDGEFWRTLQEASQDVSAEIDECFVPFNVKRKGVDLCNLLDRAREEQNLVKAEMENAWSHFSNEHSKVTEFLMALSNHEHVLDMERGEALFARQKLFNIESMLIHLQQQFSTYISVEEPQFCFIGNVHSQGSDSDTTAVDDEEEIIVCADINDSENELSDNEYDSANDDGSVDD